MTYLEKLQEYDYDISYFPGTQNMIQDTLSRCSDYKEPSLPKVSLADLTSVELRPTEIVLGLDEAWLANVKEGYRQDSFFQKKLQRKSTAFRWRDDGLLIHERTGRLCIPNTGTLQQDLLWEAHDALFGGGHFSVD